MKYTINSATRQDLEDGTPKTDSYGNESYSVLAQDEQGQTYSFFKNVKSGRVLKPGDFLYGTLSHETSLKGNKYWKFTQEKKEFTPPTHTAVPSDPDRQNSIEFQSARRDAIEFMNLRVKALEIGGIIKPIEIVAYITPETVLKLTHTFMDRTAKTETQEAAQEVFKPRTATEVIMDEPLPEYQGEDEVDISDVPF